MFQRYVACVLFGCCKSRSECCIRCNGYTHMLQAFVPDVSSVFQTYVASVFIYMFHIFHTYVASVFICMLCTFVMVFQVYSDIFASVSYACFKYFICLLLYVASVLLVRKVTNK